MGENNHEAMQQQSPVMFRWTSGSSPYHYLTTTSLHGALLTTGAHHIMLSAAYLNTVLSVVGGNVFHQLFQVPT